MTQTPDIYLIDNDPVFVTVAEILFLSAGAKSVNAIENTAEALAQLCATAKKNSLLVLNLNMRGLDGLAVMRILSQAKFPGWVAISSSESGAIRDSVSRLAQLLGLHYAGDLQRPIREIDIERLLSNLNHNDDISIGISPLFTKNDPIIGIKPVYQPKVSASTGEIVGAESLMRLQTSKGDLISPIAFIEKHTREGTLKQQTLMFLDQILADMLDWKSKGFFPVISVNAPAPVIENPKFLVSFAKKVRGQGISPSQLTIELTESALPDDPGRLIEILTRLRMSGFGLALDDFGTGMANFDMLRMCPFSELKIDRSLAQTCVSDPLSCGIVETCATICRDIGITLVAEGVETDQQELALQRLGVDVFQGFLFGKGVPANEFAARLAQESNTLAYG
jgi:EAL domain-containing protein (putative c-di-GMP-specific phosphodiesterase class I)/CheY-like chemotaxis protein